MNPDPEIRAQLEALRIPPQQRPGSSSVFAGGGVPAASGPRVSVWRRLRRWVVLALLVAATLGAYTEREPIAQAIRGATATKVPLLRVVRRADVPPAPLLTATGKIVSDHKVQVATKVSGQIVGLHFEQGDRVEKGQLLARIEDTLYRARVNEATANLEGAKARLEYEQASFERVARLHTEGSAPSIEFAEARRALAEANAQVDASQAALDFARKTLDDCAVTAPIAGVVLERNVEVGDFVAAEGGRGANANAQFAAIADMTKLRVEVDISELDIHRLRPDTPCTIIPDAYKDRRYAGRVLWIDPGANYSKATVQVKVRIDNPDERLRVEGSAQVTFWSEDLANPTTSRPVPGIWIPLAACRLDPSGKQAKVFLVVDGRLRETVITIGRQTAGLVEVTAGLKEGQTIAAEGVQNLADGQRVAD